MKKVILLGVGLFLNASFLSAQQSLGVPKYEFRALWITTLNNIDWPSKRKVHSDIQKAEYVKLLNVAKENRLNAIITQVRPSADALYESSYELWSEVFMSEQGTPPSPYFDPLDFMIEECRKRNLEFHAWVNPFRAISNIQYASIHPDHITRQKPNWFFHYGERVYFNAGVPEVRDYLVNVIVDIIRKYDVDGIHFDDYFYPYQLGRQEIPDQHTYEQYGKAFSNKADWRRNNMDLFVKAVSDSLKAIKPWVKFGVSPVGGWRNKSRDIRGSDTRVGQPSYDYLYADTRKWLQEGWIDYLAPQLYWSTHSNYGNYGVLLDWWDKNCFGRHIYAGQGIFKLGASTDDLTWNNPHEFGRQMRLNRQFQAVKGNIFFSAKAFVSNPLKMLDSLRKRYYAFPAFPPPMPWKDSIAPLPPDSLRMRLAKNAKSIVLEWKVPDFALDGELPYYYIVYRSEREDILQGKTSPELIVSIQKNNFYIDSNIEPDKRYVYTVYSADRLHNESQGFAWIAHQGPPELGSSTTPMSIGPATEKED